MVPAIVAAPLLVLESTRYGLSVAGSREGNGQVHIYGALSQVGVQTVFWPNTAEALNVRPRRIPWRLTSVEVPLESPLQELDSGASHASKLDPSRLVRLTVPQANLV